MSENGMWVTSFDINDIFAKNMSGWLSGADEKEKEMASERLTEYLPEIASLIQRRQATLPELEEMIRNLFARIPKKLVGFWEWDSEKEQDSEIKRQFLLALTASVRQLQGMGLDLELAVGIMFADRSLCYIAQKDNDMETLEVAMRQWNDVLDRALENSYEYELSRMHFALINAHLFYINEMFAEAKEYTEQAAEKAGKAMEQLFADHLVVSGTEQKYVRYEAWNCVLVFTFLYDQYVKLQEISSAVSVMQTVFSYFRRLKPYLQEDAGLCDTAARYLFAMSAAQNSCGDIGNAKISLEESASLYETLFKRYGRVYAQAMYLQAKVLLIFQKLQQGQPDSEQMELLDKQRRILLEHPDAVEFEIKIAEAVGIMMDVYRGFLMQMSEQYALANRAFREAERKSEEYLPYFVKLGESQAVWKSVIGKDLAHRLKGYLAACAMQIAECEYFLEDFDEARVMFEKTLRRLQELRDVIVELERLRTMSRAYMLLGDICSRKGEYDQAAFYLGQNVTITKELAQNTELLQDWANVAYGCLFAVEFETNWKKFENAKNYAEMGMEACGIIRGLVPSHESLRLEKQFEKTLKKKEKKGFFSKWF